jgi:hypothetical protein
MLILTIDLFGLLRNPGSDEDSDTDYGTEDPSAVVETPT